MTTVNALDRLITLRASIGSSGISFFVIYARYVCIHGICIIITSSGSSSSSEVDGSGAAAAPEAFLGLSFFFDCFCTTDFFGLVDL
jgi:hypothetical protein